LALQLLVNAPAEPTRVERETWLMGTRFQVVVEGPDRATGRRVGEVALREVERVDLLLSTWDADTPLSRLNRTSPGTWREVEPELEGILAETDEWARRTAGAFEARIGALVDTWDLRGAGRSPDADKLAAALASTGPAGLEFSERGLRRRLGSAWIDSGGFGKGAGLRSAARAVTEGWPLRDHRVLMDLGGHVLGLAPPEAPWTIEVAHPDRRSESVATLSIHDRSVSTSGSSERGSHILDPRTGRPVEQWGSVTVVDVDALAADVLSTALYVMGPLDGLAWAEQAGIAALFLESLDGGVAASWTAVMERWLLKKPAALPSTRHPQ